jgi:hypothetical protein
MTFHSFIPSINELSALLSSAHSSKGGAVLLERAGSVWPNPSSKSIINAWSTPHRIIQTSFLEICGVGDGGKLGCFIASSLLRSFAKLYDSPHPFHTNEVNRAWASLRSQIPSESSPKEIVLKIGALSNMETQSIEKIADAIYLAGSSSSHVSLEKWSGVGCEVEESEALYAKCKIHLDKEVSLKGAMFALFTRPISEVKHILSALEYMGSFEGRPLIIVAPMVGGEALKTIKLNTHKGVLEAYAVDAPRVTWGLGWLEDLAAFTGATLYDHNLESSFKPEYFGSALEVGLNFMEMFIYPYDDHAEKTAERAQSLLREAEDCAHPHTQDLLRSRANALSGSLVRLKVGGVTETEARYNRILAEKALLSMSDAVRNGYVAGAIPTLYNLKSGNDILDHALKEPWRIVCQNRQTSVLDMGLMSAPELQEPFPYGRLIQVLDRAISVATTLGSIGHIVRR